MQIKLEHIMLSITDEISMVVGFKQFQPMNQIMCTYISPIAISCTTDGNWGDICVLAVGDLYQLPPVTHCPMNPNDEKCPSDALHVYARNAYCDEWNTYKLKLLPGKEFTNIATDSKRMTVLN